MEIFKKIWSNFEIDLRPLKFSLKNLRPLIFLSENLRPLKKHSGRVFPINNVHPLISVDKSVSKPTKPMERVRPRYCQDLHGACPMWAYQNFCESASWKDYMFYRCCKSCTGKKNFENNVLMEIKGKYFGK